jgi:hypothetical protein
MMAPFWTDAWIEAHRRHSSACFALLFPVLFNGQTTDSPVLHFDLIDDYNCGGGLFAQDLNQKSGRASDELGLLLRGRTLSGNLDVYVGH